MKFTTAWANLSSENQVLKFIILILGGIACFFALTTLKLALREPLVVDRGCVTTAATLSDGKRTNDEIAAFLKDALAQRFNTTAIPHDGFISDEETSNRLKEQQDLKTRNLKQTVVVNAVQINGDAISVDADRLISVGEVRSAFKFPLIVRVSATTRSLSNPYGLVLEETKALKKETK